MPFCVLRWLLLLPSYSVHGCVVPCSRNSLRLEAKKLGGGIGGADGLGHDVAGAGDGGAEVGPGGGLFQP